MRAFIATHHLFVDASLEGWGAHLSNQTTSGLWSPGELGLHINLLELLAVYYAILRWQQMLTEASLMVATDSTTAAAYISLPLTTTTITTRPMSIVSGVITVLQCSTNPCYPNATMIWSQNNNNITTGVTTNTEYIADSGVITRSNLTRSYTWADHGQQIVCAATSDGTTKSSPPLQLVIWVQVTMVTFLNTSSQNEKIGTSEGSITLICVISPSNPAPSVSWYKNGQQINSGVTNTHGQKTDGLTVTTSSLSLTVSRSDDGHAVYCTAGIPGQTTPVTSNTGILDVG
ncbi:uncharacterized protein LOC121391289, partial [Gigantopelta aegis]|uniref:uncharacterized protein LOC121391289 n=1 Tax=Gigantopelta aegis TaxID=1735272 RepID=UPI001B888815